MVWESRKFGEEHRKHTVSTDKRFLVIGSGSAGRRHALSLRQLFPSAEITVVKRSSSQQPLEILQSSGILIVDSLKRGALNAPDFVVIASPATFHLDDLSYLSNHCSRFLLEKPIAATSHDARKLHALATDTNLHVVVGHHLRFSDTPLALKHAMNSIRDESPVGLTLAYGQHLRHWRPGVNQENTVTALKSLGGGVLRELSHEIDAVSFLGSPPNVVRSALLSYDGAPTDGNVETSADFLVASDGFTTRIHLDMITEVPYRRWDVIYPTFTLQADLLNGTVTKLLANGPREQLFVAKTGERDRAATSLLEYSIRGTPVSPVSACDIAQGVRILNTIEAVEQSAKSGEPTDIAE